MVSGTISLGLSGWAPGEKRPREELEDCSPALVRVIKTTSAVKNLQQLAQDADLALLQVPLGAWGDALSGQDGQCGGRLDVS